MRTQIFWRATLVVVCAAAASSSQAQVVMLNGKATNFSDSNSGRLLTVVSARSGGARVAVTTDPSVALVCDNKLPVTTCSAWVQAGSRISVSMRRPESVGAAFGRGTAPNIRQWRADCAGETGPVCTVKMDVNRTVEVNWGF